MGELQRLKKGNQGQFSGSHRRRCPSKIPKIRQMLREFFGNKDLKLNIPPEHAVAHGAAILVSTCVVIVSMTMSISLRQLGSIDKASFSIGIPSINYWLILH